MIVLFALYFDSLTNSVSLQCECNRTSGVAADVGQESAVVQAAGRVLRTGHILVVTRLKTEQVASARYGTSDRHVGVRYALQQAVSQCDDQLEGRAREVAAEGIRRDDEGVGTRLCSITLAAVMAMTTRPLRRFLTRSESRLVQTAGEITIKSA